MRAGARPAVPDARRSRFSAGSIAGRVAAKGVHHIGVAVADLDEAVATYERLFGATVEHRDTLAREEIEAAMLRVGEDRVELIAPLGAETHVGRFLAKRGPGLHHVAYEVAEVAGELETLAAQGAELIDTTPRTGVHDLTVAFVHPDAVHGVLVELVSDG